MRTTPVLGRKAWFGPRRVGWGLGPVSPEGWIVTLGFTALGLFTKRRTPSSQWIRYASIGVFLLFIVLKGTSPGGARARAEFDAVMTAQADR
jgi:hypothetical protein